MFSPPIDFVIIEIYIIGYRFSRREKLYEPSDDDERSVYVHAYVYVRMLLRFKSVIQLLTLLPTTKANHVFITAEGV